MEARQSLRIIYACGCEYFHTPGACATAMLPACPVHFQWVYGVKGKDGYSLDESEENSEPKARGAVG